MANKRERVMKSQVNISSRLLIERVNERVSVCKHARQQE